METKKEHNPEKKDNQLAKTKKKKKCSNFPVGFSVGFLVMGIITVALVSLLITPMTKNNEPQFTLEDAKVKTAKFINETLLDGKDEISIKKGIEENGLYKITVTTSQEQDVDIYLSKDGKLFIQEVLDIEKIKKEKEARDIAGETENKDVPKNDKPVVELFVMSHCPFGTQIEKGILPVLETLGDEIDFELKFCDYAMHSKKELDEQLRQHCIKTEEPDKFISYLECFLEADKSDECLKTVKINTSKLNACVSVTDKKYKVTENFNDKSTWKTDRDGNPAFPIFDVDKADVDKYSVGGSPTLVINGTTAKSGRDAASLLATICSGFDSPPEECSTELSSETPSPGFGFSTTEGGDAASCN